MRHSLLIETALRACMGIALAGMMAGTAKARDTELDADTAVERINVIATRHVSDSFDYAGSVSTVEREDILDFQPSQIADLFAGVPGARFDGGPRRTGAVPSVRGLSGAGVLVFLDGARQSFLSGHDGRLFVDPDIIETVEIVRGPSSALYGSGAMGGVIALRTLEADQLLGDGERAMAAVSVGYQSVNQEWRGGLTGLWQSADERVDVMGHYTRRESGDIALGSGLDLPSKDAIDTGLVKARYRPSDNLVLSGSWVGYRSDSLDPNNPQGAGIAEPGNETVARQIANDTLQLGLDLTPGGDLIDLSLVAYQTESTVEEAELSSVRVIERAVETTGLSLDNVTRLAPATNQSLLLTYGVDWHRDSQTGRDNATADGTRGGVPDAETDFLGVFAQAEWLFDAPGAIPGDVEIVPGLRWDRFDSSAKGLPDASDEATSSKLSLRYRPDDRWLLFVSRAEAFRAPSFNEIYADGDHFRIPDLSAFPPLPPTFVRNEFIENTTLKPEESENWEAGLGLRLEGALTPGDRLDIKGSWFQADVTNLIDLEVRQPAGCFGALFPPCGSGRAFGNTSRYLNVIDATLEGVEMEAFYEAGDFAAQVSLATIDGENNATGAPVGILSPATLFADINHGGWHPDWRFGGRITLAGDFDQVTDPALERDGYTKADLYAVWSPARFNGLRLDLGIDNVTDENYEVVAAGVSQPGRNYKIGLRYRFG